MGIHLAYDRSRNGRSAVTALRMQCEGDASNALRKARAYAKLENALYKGERKKFPFSRYIAIHQECHNELESLGEPVAPAD